MKTVSQTTHGAEVRTTNEPFSAGVSTHTSYSDGGTAESTGTINGQLTTSVVVPTETTISKSSVALYLYVYRVTGDHVELICTDSVVFSRVAASGSGDNAAGAELGAGIGNLIRASGDRHREDRLYQGALNAIRADAEDNGIKRDALPEDHTARVVTAPLPAPVAPSAPQASAQASLVIDSTPPGADIEIDGAFVGNTPSTVTASPGSHQVAVKRKGFTDWTKTLNVTGGTIHLIAELEQAPAVPTQ
jgi:hypothetical protein